jgi:hypothetical protein
MLLIRPALGKNVAHALVRAVSTLVSIPSLVWHERRRDESRRSTQSACATITALFAFACAVARAEGHAGIIALAGAYTLTATWLCVRFTNDSRMQWPVLVCALCNPYLYDQTSLYRLNPELANVYVMPVLLAAQPALLPLAITAGAAYAIWKRQWARTILLVALWAIAIEFLFSMRLEPFAAIAEVNR